MALCDTFRWTRTDGKWQRQTMQAYKRYADTRMNSNDSKSCAKRKSHSSSTKLNLEKRRLARPNATKYQPSAKTRSTSACKWSLIRRGAPLIFKLRSSTTSRTSAPKKPRRPSRWCAIKTRTRSTSNTTRSSSNCRSRQPNRNKRRKISKISTLPTYTTPLWSKGRKMRRKPSKKSSASKFHCQRKNITFVCR